MSPSGWTYMSAPGEPGIYAVATCWDPDEGIFPKADCWDGKAWASSEGQNSIGFAGPFTTIDEALDWARAHDPEGL